MMNTGVGKATVKYTMHTHINMMYSLPATIVKHGRFMFFVFLYQWYVLIRMSITQWKNEDRLVQV